MKKTFYLAGIASLLLHVAQAQQPSSNPTVDSIKAKYTLAPMPAPMSQEAAFPVIGVYQSNNNADQKLTIKLDEQNKGMAWIDGLPQGSVKAILKRSPAVYKIPAQKTADGKDVLEGTLIYDKDANQINVVIGRAFNDSDPASVFTTQAADEPATVVVTKSKGSKTKEKVKQVAPWTFVGSKIEHATAAN